MASTRFEFAAAGPAPVSEEAPSTIGKGKRHSLPISQFTFEPPSTPRSALVTTPDDETQSVSWDPTTHDDVAEAAGNTTPKLKARRVSTSALPTLAGPSSNWAFRDEMGIPNRGDASTPGPSRPNVERSESAESPYTARVARPRKALSMSADARQLEAAAESQLLKPATKRARRNMWTEEETMHLVDGCKVVSFRYSSSVRLTIDSAHSASTAWRWELEDDSRRPPLHIPG